MDHALWLRDVRSHIQELNNHIVGLTNKVDGLVTHTRQLQQLTGNSLVTTDRRGQMFREMHEIHSDIREALAVATDLGHETELVLDAEYFIQRLGIDLDDVLQRDELSDSAGQVSFRQRNRAVLSSGENSPEPMVVAPGEMGIHVPFEADVFGQSIDFEINTNAIIKRQRANNQFEFVCTRHVHLDKSVATRTISRTIRERASKNIERYHGRDLPTLPSANFGQGDPRYYSSAFDGQVNLIRFFGTYGGKRRSRFARLQTIPAWAHVGIKTGSHIFVEMLHKKIREAGLTPGAVQFVGGNRFRTTATTVRSRKKRITCTDFGATVRMTFFLEGHIYPVGTGRLRLQVREYQAVDTDIQYHPRAVDFLLRWADGFVESIIAHMVPAVTFSQSFFIPNARRVTLDLNKEHFLALIALR